MEKGWFGRGELFTVEVEGGSMPGGCAAVRAQAEAENGDIVVAPVEGETTVKKFCASLILTKK